MRALVLNFANGPSRLRRTGNVLFVLSLLLAAAVAWQCLTLVQERDTWRAKRAGLLTVQRKAAAAGGGATAGLAPAMAGELNYARGVIDRLSLPWDRLFNEMDASVDEHVVLLGVEPDAGTGKLMLTAEARSFAAMLDYEKRLSQSALLRDIHVQSHQVQVQNTQRPVRFVIGASWISGADGEPVLSDGAEIEAMH